MPNVASPLGTTQRYIPAIVQTQIGRYAGLAMHFPTLAALNNAVADEVLNIGETSALWADNQPFTVATEAGALVTRLWKVGLQHARTVVLSQERIVVLDTNTNTVLTTVGTPSGGVGSDGDIAVDRTNNTYYTKTTGAWVSSGTINALGPADKAKLTGIAAGATVNSSDAQLRDRSTHTGTQLANTISDFSEAVDDRVNALLVPGTNISIVYNDVANTLTVSAAGGGATNLTATLSPTAITVNSDTGTDATIPAADGTNAGLMLPAEKTKLAGVASNATNTPLASTTPAALGTAAVGVGTSAARSDHVHAMPTKADVGLGNVLNVEQAPRALTVQAAKTGNYTLQATDSRTIIPFSQAATVTVPNGLGAGFSVILAQTGTGAITLTGAATRLGASATAGQGELMSLTPVGTDSYICKAG